MNLEDKRILPGGIEVWRLHQPPFNLLAVERLPRNGFRLGQAESGEQGVVDVGDLSRSRRRGEIEGKEIPDCGLCRHRGDQRLAVGRHRVRLYRLRTFRDRRHRARRRIHAHQIRVAALTGDDDDRTPIGRPDRSGAPAASWRRVVAADATVDVEVIRGRQILRRTGTIGIGHAQIRLVVRSLGPAVERTRECQSPPIGRDLERADVAVN